MNQEINPQQNSSKIFVQRFIDKGELPEKTGLYHTDLGRINWFNGLKHFEHSARIKYWLEELPLPSINNVRWVLGEGFVKKALDRYSKEEISFGKLVELLNQQIQICPSITQGTTEEEDPEIEKIFAMSEGEIDKKLIELGYDPEKVGNDSWALIQKLQSKTSSHPLTIDECKDKVAKENGYRILTGTKGWNRWDKMYDESSPLRRIELLDEVIKLLSPLPISLHKKMDELIKFRNWVEDKLAPQDSYCITDDIIKEYCLLKPKINEKKDICTCHYLNEFNDTGICQGCKKPFK